MKLKNLMKFVFIIAGFPGCASSNNLHFSGDGFSASFISKPNIRYENIDKNRNFMSTSYEAISYKENSFLAEVIQINKLQESDCVLNDKELLDKYINSTPEPEKVDTNPYKEETAFKEWQVIKDRIGSVKPTKILRSVLKQDAVLGVAVNYQSKIVFFDQCKFYSLFVFGSNQTEVDNLFEHFIKSFEFESNKGAN